MKHFFLTAAAFFFLLQTVSSQTIIYMKENANGNGTSWSDATGDLQQALAKAKPGTQIWVAAGTYLPIQCTNCNENDRSATFLIPDGVKVYGGFQGDEKRLRQRNPAKYPARLSGNIGQPGPTDNSYTVVTTQSVSPATLLDGLVIADGQADANRPEGHPFRSGGGLYNDGAGKGNQSHPEVHNCLFINNFALEGGAIYNNGKGGNASPNLSDCTFTTNRAANGGGAVFHQGAESTGNLNILYSQFVSNEAAFGPAVFCAFSNNETDPNVFNSSFVNNKSRSGGSLVFLGLSEIPAMRTLTFVNNTAEHDYEEISVGFSTTTPGSLMAEMPLDEDDL